MKQTKVAIIGASGYTGEELIRYLLRHPNVEITCVTSRQHAGKTIGEVYPRFRQTGPGSLVKFILPEVADVAATGAEVAFLAVPHGVAIDYAGALLEAGLVVIDLSADFRLRDADVYQEYYDQAHPRPDLLKSAVYGLPEAYAEVIRKSNLIASPGCYPTSVLMPLLPLLREKLIKPDSIHVFSMSGVSGAGRKESIPLLFCECNESVRPYSVPKHRHLSEIEQELSLAAGEKIVISFTTHLVPVHSGIVTTIYAAPTDQAVDLNEAYSRAYGSAPFVRLLGKGGCPDSKNVTGTNFIDLGWVHDPRTNRYVLMSTEDNIGKGAAAQAVQSFNLRFGHAETAGLLVF
jgi:N-acetyl-gamma-glutamyl-phosphate reductase